MLGLAHELVMGLFVVLPVVMVAGMVVRRGRRVPVATVGVASAMLLGVSASVIYDLWLGGISSPLQMLITCYWAAGLLGILKLMDLGLDRSAHWCLERATGMRKSRRQGWAEGARVVLLFAIGIPFMVAAAATYRPRVTGAGDGAWIDQGASVISFAATDGVRLSGFWVTPRAAGGDASRLWGRQTVVICPGTRAGKSAYPTAAGEFLSAGYNVLTFDFRAHGQSEGEIDSFGDLERKDVLGAVRWLRNEHPHQSRRIVALGMDTGAAALLAAAADDSTEGRAIDAMAVIGCYDRFSTLVETTALPPIFGRMIAPIAVPLACVQTGADLLDFSPARAAAAIAPRPILFVQSEHDPVVTFDRGQALFDAACEPKAYIWLDQMTNEEAAGDIPLLGRIRRFLDTAVPIV
jgi:alpha-beta hydrolase superfamily lysophospholipase